MTVLGEQGTLPAEHTVSNNSPLGSSKESIGAYIRHTEVVEDCLQSNKEDQIY